MRRGKAVLVLGIIVALIPALGIPQEWIDFLVSVLGILIAFIGLSLRRPSRQPSLFDSPQDLRNSLTANTAEESPEQKNMEA